MGDLMNWYQWDTQADFDLWHNALCESLGYPLIGTNQATGLPDTKAQMTIAYTETVEVEGKFIASVEAEHAESLTQTALRPLRPE